MVMHRTRIIIFTKLFNICFKFLARNREKNGTYVCVCESDFAKNVAGGLCGAFTKNDDGGFTEFCGVFVLAIEIICNNFVFCINCVVLVMCLYYIPLILSVSFSDLIVLYSPN